MRKIERFLMTMAEPPQSGRRALSGLFKSKAMKCLLTTLLLLGSTLTSWAVREIYDLPTEQPVLIDESNYQQYGLTSEYIGYLGLSKPQHLYWMTDMGRGRAPINYVLLNDIVMNSGSGTKKRWVPLGGRVYNRVIHSNGTLEVSLNEERAYTGTFDGNGHTISGLYFDNTGSILMITQEESNDYAVSYEFVAGPKVGFIGVANGATIKNLGIINATIINDDYYVGGIVGYCINASAENYNGPTTITNCWFEGEVRGKNYTGGICGYGGNITKCYNTGTVSGAYYTGGICGYGGNITNCYNTGAVSGSSYTGGICGNGGTQTNCYTTGMVSSSSSYFGGICGSSGTQNNCYYLEGSCSSRGGGVSATADEFASGKIAYLLNGNTFDGTTWRQTLFTDAAPLLAASHKAVTGYINEVDNVITTYGNVALSTDYTVGEGKTLIIPEGATVTTIGSSKIINNGTLIVEGTISGNNLDGNGAFYYAQLDDADVTLNTVSVPYKGSAYTVGDLDVSYASHIYKGKTFTYSNTATMTYQNNTSCGTATVTWNGSITREFTIAPKAVTNPTVELSATVFTYSGNEQKPTVTLKDGETVIDPSEYTVTYPSDVVNEGDKTITITDNEGGNYIISECSAEYSIVLDPEIVDGFYQIGNAKQLAWFANLVNSGTTNANAVLVSNIVVNSNVLATDGSLNDDGSNFSVWTPIGTSSRKYTGTFNGQGHTISGLYYNNSTASYVGLFGCADGATITKVGVVDSYLKGNQYVGGICGNGGTIIGCHNASNVSGNSNVGGICGNGGTQTSCYSIGTVSGSAICGNGGTQTLCYYLTGSATSAGGGTNVSETAFTNGEAAYMLNGSTSEGDILWYQDIGADAMPTTNNRHGIVYYSNNLYGNGICPSQIADAAQAEALGLSSSYVGYYAIGSADELYGFSELVKRGTTSANGVLTDDIVVNRNVLNEDGTLNGDGSNFRKWIPIGTSGNSYLGKFNGNGHTVSGLYFDDSEANNVGLFGFLYTNSYDGGSIEDVGVVDSYFNGYQNVGGICGYVLSSNSYGCSIFRCYSTSTISGWRNVGGICGYSSSEINYITHCYNAGSVSGHYDVGGICGGGSYYGKVTVNCCFNVGSVSATNYYDADGICPHAGTRIKCYSLENSAPTLLSSSTIIASASEFASGKIAYLIGEYFRQTLFSDAYPSFNKNSNWVTGYIDEDGDVLTVVGNPVLTTNYTIAEGKTLVIPEGTSYDDRPSIETTGDAVITNNGTIICNGTITGNDLAGNGSFIFENLTSNDVILNTASYPYKGTAYTLEDGLDITISRVMCGKTFTYYNPETPLEVVYYNNVNVGTTASISWRKTFWSEQYSEYIYRQYAYKTFSITPKEVELVWLQSELPYSGEAQAPTVRVIGIYENDEYKITVEGAQSAVGGPYTATATGLSNENYKLPENKTKEFSIAQKEVGLAWSNTSLTYNGSAQAPTATATGLVSGDVCSVTVTGAQTNCGTNYTATATGLSNGNYKLPEAVSQAFAIGAKEVSLAWSNTSLIYNGNAQAPTASATGLFGNDVCNVTVSGEQTNVGTYTATATTLDNDNYKLPEAATSEFKINPKEVTLAWGETSFTYNGSAQAPTSTATGLISNDECTVTVEGAATNVGNHTATATGLSNGNYKLSEAASQAFAIGAKEVSLAWSNTSLIYNGNAQAPTASAEGLIENDVCTVTVEGAATNVGNYTATATGLSNGNYKLPEATSLAFAIGAKEVSLAWSNTSLIYNGNAQAPTATAEGLVGNDDCAVTVEGAATNVGNYTATATALDNGNYKLPEAASQAFAIGAKEVSLAWSNTLLIYNGNAQVATATAEGLIGDEICTVTVSGAKKDQGNYTATATALSNANYKLPTDVTSAFTIAAKEIGLAWSNTSLIYNGAEQIATASAEGIEEGDECTVTVSGEQTNVGTYTATAESLSNSNYKLPEAVTSEFAIAPKTGVVVTITENRSEVVYNTNEQSVEGYTFSINDELSIYAESDFAFSGNAVAKGTTVGKYAMELSAANFENKNENFAEVEFVIVDGELTITKAAEAPNKPEAAMETHYVNTQLVALPENWIWAEYAALVEGDNTATANYDGSDKGNYVVESVAVTIKRLPCLHNEGNELLYTLEPTCTHKGYTGNLSCKLCGEIYEMGDSIPALGHIYDTVAVAATCTTEGCDQLTCSRCGDVTRINIVPANGHKADSVVFVNVVAATCTTAGSYDSVTYCTVCNAEISHETIVVAALGHTAGEPVVENFVAPTCTEAGAVDTVVYCTVDNAELNRVHQVIPALGHEAGRKVAENFVASTTTTEGSVDSVVYCTRCKVEISRETFVIPISDHEHIAGAPVVENFVAPTCTEAGSVDTAVYCTVNGELLSLKTTVLPALGHKADSVVKENVVNATFEAAGSYELVTYCSVCGAEISREKVEVPQLVKPVEAEVVEIVISKLEYTVGDSLKLDGGKIVIATSDSTTAEVAITSEMISGFNSDSVGVQTVTVAFEIDGVAYTTTFDVEVKEAEVIEVVAKSVALSAPVKITYKKGEALDVAGGKLTVTYSNGTTQDVELKADMVSGFDAEKVGAQQLTVTLTVDKVVLTASFDVTIEADDDTAISDDEAAAVNIYAYQNVIVVESADALEGEISIFDVNGRMVAKELAAGSRTEIMMQQQGIYIVKVNNTAKRVMVY